MIPNLFIVGAPKCGTTSLHYYLDQHPDIFLSDPKEPNFYNTDLKRKHRISRADYLALFANARGKYRGEATPLYLMSKEAPRNIKQDAPDAKIIIMLRKPVELMFSAYLQNRYNFVEEEKTFESALAREEERRKDMPSTKTGEPINRLFYREMVNFHVHISRYFKTFGRENVHVILFDNFKNDTEREVKRVMKFLGVNADVPVDYALQNPATLHKYPRLAYMIFSPPKVIRKAARIIFPAKRRAAIYQLLKRANTKQKIKKESISISTKERLLEELKPGMERLERLLQTDLSHWKI